MERVQVSTNGIGNVLFLIGFRSQTVSESIGSPVRTDMKGGYFVKLLTTLGQSSNRIALFPQIRFRLSKFPIG